MKKHSRATDADDADPRNVPAGATRLIASYCIQDVRLLSSLWGELSESLTLTPLEKKVQEAHDAINERGVRLDLPVIRTLLDLSDQSIAEAVEEIALLTGGERDETGAVIGGALNGAAVLRKRNAVMDWLERYGLKFTRRDDKTGQVKKTLRREVVEQFLREHEQDEDLPPAEDDSDPEDGGEVALDPKSIKLCVRVLTLRNAVLRITGKKLTTALASVQADGVCRGLFTYHAAHCVSGETEVLTRTGWVRIDAWTGGEIMQWTPSGVMEWLPATANRFETDEPTVELKGPHVTGRFTLGHNVPAYNTVGAVVDMQAGQMANHPHYCLPLTGARVEGDGSITADQMRVLVAVQADGHWSTNTRHGRGLQFTFRKARKIARMKVLLDRVGVPFRVREFPSCPGQFRVSVRWADCPPWLSPDRKVFGAWLFDSTGDARTAFEDELPKWDGHTPSKPGANREYCSHVPENLEWAQTMCHLAGTACKISGTKLILRDTRYASCRAHEWMPADPLPEVYCPTTATGYWLYRHNGRIGVTGNTGRWGGRRIQVQNLTRPHKDVDPWACLRSIRRWSRRGGKIRDFLPPVGKATLDDVVGSLLRAMFVPHTGHECLMAADYSSIESRVLAWLAGESTLLQAFWNWECPYSLMASKLYGRPVQGKKDPIRQVGKVIVLGCGYGLGSEKFASYGAAMGIDFDEAGVTPEQCVETFRTTFPRIAGEVMGEYKGRLWRRGGFWNDLHDASIAAVQNAGLEVPVGRLVFEKKRGHLYMVLPSGRAMCYRSARIVKQTTRWGKEVECVEYQSPRFRAVTLYGGKLAENAVQGVARDPLAEALVRLEAARLSTVLQVHDEAVGSGMADEFPAFMREFTTAPAWASGLPLDAEGGILPRYGKSPPKHWPKEQVWRNGHYVREA